MKRSATVFLFLAYGMLVAQTATDPARLSSADKEKFLKKAKVVKTHGTELGITGTTRATLNDGKLTHDCGIQTIDEFKPRFESQAGIEFNFKDSYLFNLAAYKLDRILGLNMVPVAAVRYFDYKKGSWAWWVDNEVMTEKGRFEKKADPPNLDAHRACVRSAHIQHRPESRKSGDRQGLANLDDRPLAGLPVKPRPA